MPEDWKVPILFKMIPEAKIDEVKLKHKYAQGVDKTYAGFSRILIELADEKRHEIDSRGRGKDDMNVDALARQKRDEEYEPTEEEYEFTEEENREYGEWLQEEISWLGAKGKGRGKGKNRGGKNGGGKGPTGAGNGKGASADLCHWCKKPGHVKSDCR